MSEKANKKVNDLVDSSIDRLNGLADVDMVIGAPILTASGTQVIPVSKVTVGYLSGGGDLGQTKIIKKDETMPFAGGSGAVVTMKLAGFLIDDGKGCRYIHAGDDPVDNLIDKASELLKGFQRGSDG